MIIGLLFCLSLDSIVNILASCIGASATVFIAFRYSQLKVDATAFIDDSTEDEKNACHSKGCKESPCGFSIVVVNDGLCKITTSFFAKYRYRRFLRRNVFHSIYFGFDKVTIASGAKERLVISNQSVSSLIEYIFKHSGKGKLLLEYSRYGSKKIRYATVDTLPIMMSSLEISYNSPKCYLIGNIGRLLDLLLAELCTSKENSNLADDNLAGHPDEILYKLIDCIDIAKNMTASFYNDQYYHVCSNADLCCKSSSSIRHCTFEKYKACAIQMENVFEKYGLISVDDLFTPHQVIRWQSERKMKEGVIEKIMEAINEWVTWHNNVGVDYRYVDRLWWWGKRSIYSDSREIIKTPFRLSLLEREEKLPP